MPTQTIWELIAKKLSGEATLEELVELESLLRANPDMHYPLQTVADLWHHATPDTENAHLAFDAHAARMKEMGAGIEAIPPQLIPSPGKKQSKKFLLLALSLSLVGICFYVLSTQKQATVIKPGVIPDKSEVSTKYGSRTNLRLPDGTQVWLNSGSKLSYDKTYGNTTREVALLGEAYFDVVKNPTHPFIIHTSNIDIKVLGTAFNVKSFPNEKNTETSLIRGSIEVTLKNRASAKIILKPNEKLITANSETAKEVDKLAADDVKTKAGKEQLKQEPLVMVSHLTYQPRDSTVVETSWMDNKLIFRSETFEDLAVRMERWYGVTIRFTDEKIKPKKVNGIFENESVQQALQALQLITAFTYSINKNAILISSR